MYKMKKDISSKGLTIRYGIHQLLFFSISAGISTFAVTYLLEKGFNTTQIGALLATSNLLSCMIQPLVGDIVDRFRKFILPQTIALIFAAVFLCFSVIQFLNPPTGIFGLLYGTGVLLASITNSLNNSLCAYYSNHNYPINYGVGLGVGSLAFSFASLGYGYIMAWLGVDWMVWIVLAVCIVLIIVVMEYPGLSILNIRAKENRKKEVEERVSLWTFFSKYKLFTFTMSGVMLIAMCHTMSENYFIKIFQSVGGGSEDVGVAMFIACLSAAPYYLFFEKIEKRISIHTMLKTAGVFFMIKTILLLLATRTWHVYLIQLLQTFTYGFIYQPLYYFARKRIAEADLAKGQAVVVSLYTLGSAIGSFVGGRVLDLFGLDWMLWLALGIAFVGTIIIHTALKMIESERMR